MVPIWLPNGPWRSLGGLLERLKRLDRPKGVFQRRMGRSWTPLGALLEAFGAQQTLLGSALGRAPRRLVSNCLGAQWAPKRGPGGSQNWLQKRIKLKMGKPQKTLTMHRISLICQVQGFLFGAHSGSKMGSESHLRCGRPQKASWRTLGALLEASGAERT